MSKNGLDNVFCLPRNDHEDLDCLDKDDYSSYQGLLTQVIEHYVTSIITALDISVLD